MKGLRRLPSKEDIEKVISYNQETGEFIWKITSGKACAGDHVKTEHAKGYTLIHINNKLYMGHRIAWIFVHGSIPDETVIDHIDGNPKNNKISNLRLCKQFQNGQNRRGPNRNNKSGYIGVIFDKKNNKWYSQVTKNRKVTTSRRFNTAYEAHIAYVEIKRKLHTFSPEINQPVSTFGVE